MLKTRNTLLLEAQATIGKPALRAIAFFTAMRTSIYLATFDTVVNDLRALGLKEMLILPVIVKPQAKEQRKAAPQVKEEKYIYIESDHREQFGKTRARLK
ncbi:MULTISPECIES: hypothetical protein [unclassified Lentimonas]|uniref:hypothetical protein n=1 Tax=unclassified Lentimonas TaxID=2630993 RepID=UPI001322469D|nr:MULTISPECIES: hypothetical protein [unclassified Lentimonas]CAA6691183.1 Unannotated [Lentimonas sp. CC19]CAA6694739.1 Unannotated [Lentimonas sp. CC10]CAA7071563.1 Unannotated [Lentimonas sp. CC11]